MLLETLVDIDRESLILRHETMIVKNVYLLLLCDYPVRKCHRAQV